MFPSMKHNTNNVWVVLKKTLESPRGCKEIQPVHSKGDHSWAFFGRMMLKLKLQYVGHLMRRADSFAKTLMLGKIESRRRGWGWDGWMASPTRWMWFWVNSGSWWWTGRPGVLQFMGSQSQTWLSDFTFTFHFHALEKEMATHSSVLAWRIPGTGEPGGLLSMGSHRVGHDWSDLAAAVAGAV